ncbi:TPA: DUF4236 domain-containing protein [Kluyvera intermedia]|uniref:Membrane protein n=2 Tax=Enterobacteriaceae TaxID=543 RepID=A0AAC8QM03_9ENTR|nr:MULTISPECIES: DUF4236 domain-containing protein [Enterobacteriaceae]HAT2204015.1 DUF4236 domain-containing protein [Kluyvera intermedia]AKL11128.1 membrane protein [Phytobacter ursingii]MCL9670023.1 DUF4236 domain-containing protein [Citrobacter sp. MNAZ 1397]HAT2514728.1 DUF4236 domain-containing protein [Kluyvera intermedia]HAT2602617.1 DUF4236 domain-containing protein [Kluyvera intermedia]
MSFYIKKSIRVGPMRFNLSKSGVGASIGIRGLRFGTGPRGNYIHIGAGGVYYRASLSPSLVPQNRKKFQHVPDESPIEHDTTHASLEEIESSHISEIVDSSSRELLEELNNKRKKSQIWPLVMCLSIALLLYGFSQAWPEWCLATGFIVGVAFSIFAYMYDQLRKTTVLFYDIDDQMMACYQQLHDSGAKLASCSKVWHIEASGAVYDPKYHAGAGNLLRRKVTSISKSKPPFVKTNIETIAINVGRQTLHFFPDRVLVYDREGVGAVGYNQLFVNVGDSQFIESETVPRDALIVGRTWKYVNKSGGPDRRFKDNTELPICLYENLSFTSHSGLNELLQLSKTGHGKDFSLAIKSLSKNVKSY